MDPLVLQYGASKGFVSFRRVLADYLSMEYGYKVKEEELMVTCGNSQAIDLAGRLFLKEGDEVIMEQPSYFLARTIFDACLARRVGVEVDEEGMKVEKLEKMLEKGEVKPKLVYTIPNYQNPTGSCLSEERKKKLVELARKYEFVILADEPYNLLHWDEGVSKPSPLVKYDCFEEGEEEEGRKGVVASCGSFSKILAPGLRLGWIHAHPSLLSRFESHGVISSGGGLNPFTSFSVKKLIETGGLKENVERLNDVLGGRCKKMVKELKEGLPKGCTTTQPGGGYFIWVTLPEGIKAKKVREVGKEKYGVVFVEGGMCNVVGERGLGNCLRLSFAFYDEKEIEIGVKGLCEAIGECIGEKNESS